MDGTYDDDRRLATREAVRSADLANGEPGATDDEPDTDGGDPSGGDADDSPGGGIQRGVEPPEPNEPA